MQQTRSSDRRGKIPAYIQVAAALRRRIETGAWQPTEKISTLEELEQEFQVARVTVRQAVDLLEREGLVTRQQGRGTFVSATVNDKRWFALQTSWDGVIASVKNNVPQFITVANPPLAPRLRDGDGLPAEEYVFLRSVQLKDGVPYAVASVHLAKPIFDRRRDDFLKHTALPIVAAMKRKLSHAHQTLVIGTADPEIADLLQVSLSAPTAEVRWVLNDETNVAIYVADIAYRADCVKMSIDFFQGVGSKKSTLKAA